MTTITLKINERTKAGKAFLALADTFLKNQTGIEIIKEQKETNKATAIRELSKKINKAATKRMLEAHDLL